MKTSVAPIAVPASLAVSQSFTDRNCDSCATQYACV